MARRKPQHVKRNRRQNAQPRGDVPHPSAPLDAQGGDASNAPPYAAMLNHLDEREDAEDVHVEAASVKGPPTKRPRFSSAMFSRSRESVLDCALDLQVGVPSKLLSAHVPWNDARRAQALWISVSVDVASRLHEKLESLEASGAFDGCDASAQTVGFVACNERGNVATDPPPLTLEDLCDGWGQYCARVLDAGLVTMEVKRLFSDDGVTYAWRIAVDWRAAAKTPVSVVHDLMLWLLYHSKDVGVQWSYAYPKEIDVLYERGGHHTHEVKTPFDIHDIYSKIDVQRQLARDVSNIPAHITAPGSALLPTLRDYQKAALSWMLAREGVRCDQAAVNEQTAESPRYLSRCVRFPWPSGSASTTDRAELLFDIFSCHFHLATNARQDEWAATDINAVRGGILADEMGLGKTVEVIALVLSNPSPQTQPFLLTDVGPPEDDSLEEAKDVVYGCICGSEEDCDTGWVQCDLCHVWHHCLCTGFDPNDDVWPFTVSANSSLVPDSFVCFQCQVQHQLILSCKTTLIVSPESIHDQWESELKRHVKPGSLKLMRYPGVKTLRSRLQGKGPSAEWRVLASLGAEMASFDIVLTTYEALASDLHHIPTALGRDRRSSTRQKRKKYAFIGSPLVFLHFWRVCMDEAQVGVENTQLQAALTVAELRTEIQWIVTGTPFSTQLMDLYGCFTFLRLAPYCDEDTGKRQFQNEVEGLFIRGATGRVFDLLLWDGHSSRVGGGLLWRTNKKDVLSQLGLPTQSEETVWCRLSNVERHFYNKQETEVINALRQEHAQRRRLLGEAYDKQDDSVGDNVWHRLLLLRQVCCHPQVGQTLRSIGAPDRSRARGGSSNGGDQVGMNVLTMDKFLQQLLERCRRECEEAQRKLIGAHNGHASLALINDDFSTAIIKYTMSVQLIRSNWDDFRADLLPRLHILDNLATSVRRAFRLDASMEQGVQSSETTDGEMTGEEQDTVVALEAGDGDAESTALIAPGEENPKRVSLMPALPALLRAISADGLVTEGIDTREITNESKALEAAANKIRRFYLREGEYRHSTALFQFQNMRSSMESSLWQPKPRNRGAAALADGSNDAMLCSSSAWWLEMFDTLKQLPDDQDRILHMTHRLRAHLYALGTPWSSSFAEKFHDIHGLQLAFMNELTALHKKRKSISNKLLSQSQKKPTRGEIEMSGNCRKCRDARDGPICWHCKFYKELEGYKQHLLGIDSTIAGASALAIWTADLLADDADSGGDNEDETEETLTNAASTSASTSLILDVFRQLSSGTRVLLRENRSKLSATHVKRLTKSLQEGVQQETEVWASLLREWNRAKKLFQAQHQRLGSLDELEMAQMKIRLRLPGEVVETAADKQYKLEPHEIPVKWLALDAERVVADAELKLKQSELRYLKNLQAAKETESKGTDGTESGENSSDGKTCVVCLEDTSKQRVAMLPCAHKTCLKCSNRIASQMRSSRMIRCPTCRRIFSVDERKEVENDVDRAKEVALAARTANIRFGAADSGVSLVRSGFSSKIDAILRRVRALATTNPELKALVFTQWQDMMGVIAVALQLNGIKCFTYTSKKQFHRVLQAFKFFPNACVLALPFKVGANGLNIIEATEVLLVEPLLNTSIEAQAINRVHRIGQTKPTRVHRFVVDNSVEERIHWMGHSKHQRGRHDESEVKDDEEDDGVQHDESVVVGRQEKEKLTLGQLQALLNGRAMVDNNEGEPGGTIAANDGDHPFWQQQVEMNGRVLTRRDARELLERRRAAEQRVGAAPGALPTDSSEPMTLVVDRDVTLSIAHELLQLKVSAEDSDESSEGLSELADMARHRIRDELRIWRESQ